MKSPLFFQLIVSRFSLLASDDVRYSADASDRWSAAFVHFFFLGGLLHAGGLWKLHSFVGMASRCNGFLAPLPSHHIDKPRAPWVSLGATIFGCFCEIRVVTCKNVYVIVGFFFFAV